MLDDGWLLVGNPKLWRRCCARTACSKSRGEGISGRTIPPALLKSGLLPVAGLLSSSRAMLGPPYRPIRV